MENDRLATQKKALLGFSLLELMVVIVLIGTLIAIAIPSLRGLTGIDKKGEITKIAGLAAEVYNLAAISGKTHRIVFDFDTQSYWVEEKEGEVGEIKPEFGYEDLIKERLAKKETNKEKEAVYDFLPEFKKIEGRLGEKIELAQNIMFYGAWTEQMTEIARSGQVAIYFFAGGYTQPAFVSLAVKDEQDSVMYLALSPLTGAVSIDNDEPNIEELLDVEVKKP